MVVILSDREISTEIIDLCRQGDRDAFRALYGLYKDRVYSIALYFFHGDRNAAADASQQVFLRLITGIATFRGDADFATWLYRLVVNVCMDDARKKPRREAAFDEHAAAFAAPDSPEQDAARGEIADAVRLAVSSLPPKLRMPVLLRHFDGLSYAQMAAALGCSVGTVASRLTRGHRMLAEKLASLQSVRAAR